jgi:putative two-component system response regulator
MRVLIVDDDEIDLKLLHVTLTRAGYEVDVAHNGQEALKKMRDGAHRLVISDWEMPEMSGVELCRRIRAHGFAHYIYFILVTARDAPKDVVEGMDAGADDFIAKPFEPSELCVRLRTGERILSLDSRDLMIFGLAKLAESRDPETGAHLERIREYCRVIAQDLSEQDKFAGQVDGDYVQTIFLTSPLHDIGKVGIPDNVLLKPDRLTDREWGMMKQHTIIGAKTLCAVANEHPQVMFLRMAHEIALTHHECFDGSGYPFGLAGQNIPLCGRITALADVYDALTTKRVYKDAFGHDVASSIIQEGSETHFDPDIVQSFIRNKDKFTQIREQFSKAESQRLQDEALQAVMS